MDGEANNQPTAHDRMVRTHNRIKTLRKELWALRTQLVQTLDESERTLDEAYAEISALRGEQARLNLDIKTEQEFAEELHVSTATVRRWRKDHNLDHLRPCATEILYTAAQRAAAVEQMRRPVRPQVLAAARKAS